jgi:diketogulonate reductase-like aldo/keto reductase
VATAALRTIALPAGERIVALGQGTWGMAEGRRPPEVEIAALRVGIELGMTLIDTAEMYANGGAELLVGEAIAGQRDEVFLVSKVLPGNATLRGTINACERSLTRLGTDQIDLYLLHWRGRVELAETVEAFRVLVDGGMIRYWGVSNFDLSDMGELLELPGGGAVATDQVLFNLKRRGIEHGLLPWCREHGIPIMAYSPFDHGGMVEHPALRRVADELHATPAQVALAWVLTHDDVTTIPRAGTPAHVRENRAAHDLELTPHALAELDRAFPPPNRNTPLEVL